MLFLSRVHTVWFFLFFIISPLRIISIIIIKPLFNQELKTLEI